MNVMKTARAEIAIETYKKNLICLRFMIFIKECGYNYNVDLRLNKNLKSLIIP